MRCPIEESLLIDYIEGVLNPAAEAEVRSHLAGCSDCAATLREVERMGKLLLGTGGPEIEMPAGAFWESNLRRIGEATWNRPRSWRSRLNTAGWKALAAAALLLLTFIGFSRLGLFPTNGPGNSPSLTQNVSQIPSITRDSLETMRRMLTDYTLAAEYMQTLPDLRADSSELLEERLPLVTSGPTSTPYDGLADLDEDQLDGVTAILAGF